MEQSLDIARFSERTKESEEPRQSNFLSSRIFAYYSATIALADDESSLRTIELGKSRNMARTGFYEVMLQSYLLVGFPRMLSAAAVLAECWPDSSANEELGQISSQESENWHNDGLELCGRIYAENFDNLKKRIVSLSPHIFRWMINEGYGKVYSRPGLSAIDRELANVAALVADNRPVQLHSHIRGALNVGADIELIKTVVEDLGASVGKGYVEAKIIFEKIAKAS